MQERERDNEMGAAVGMEDSLEMALKRAKRMCKAGPTEECDEMLREYFRMKTEATEEEEAPLLEKLLKLVSPLKIKISFFYFRNPDFQETCIFRRKLLEIPNSETIKLMGLVFCSVCLG